MNQARDRGNLRGRRRKSKRRDSGTDSDGGQTKPVHPRGLCTLSSLRVASKGRQHIPQSKEQRARLTDCFPSSRE